MQSSIVKYDDYVRRTESVAFEFETGILGETISLDC